MSNNDNSQDELLKEIEQRSSLIEKKRVIETVRVEKQFAEIKETEKEKERLKTVDVTAIDEGFLAKMDWEQKMMRESVSRRMTFVTPNLTDSVPFTYPNLILIGAKTGQGKSTFASNMIYQLMVNHRKSLLLSNEEKSVDVYNRLSCLHKGWNYNDRNYFTEEQWDEMTRLRHTMYRSGRVRVIDSDYDSFKDATTSYEGIKFVLDNLYDSFLEKKKLNENATPDFDCIVLDYYQKVSSSIENPHLKQWEVLKKLSDYLDNFYKKYPAPIVIFCQLKNESGDDDYFETRIKEGKAILVPATFAMELKPDKKTRVTEFIPHKHRWSNRIDQKIKLVWNKGLFVDHTPEHDIMVATENNASVESAMMDNLRRVHKGE